MLRRLLITILKMGIPSYFSYIIKNHANIIRNRRQVKSNFSSMYMDCNSIIYDCVRKIESDTEPRERGFNIEDAIITLVIAKIEKYVNDIQPNNVLYIAFDGVAPFAKMEQQRIRRHKTGYMSEIARKSGEHEMCVPAKESDCSSFQQDQGFCLRDSKGIPLSLRLENPCIPPSLQSSSPEYFAPPSWNTSAITPGTQFMNMLSLRVKRAFVESGRYFGVKTIIVSGSDEPGEGEHKMFQYIRDNALKTETIAIYGLDADLIMLSVFHCFACENIYIFRESPEFGKALLNNAFARDELLYLDNRSLANAILNEMGVTNDSKQSIGRIYDYIFACFLLGNDFLPHFPALNIRTHGNFTILEMYRTIIAKYPERRFISLETGNIQWRWVKVYLQEFAKEEPKMILNEHESRFKMEKRFYPTTTREEREKAFENIPTIYRAEEHYINSGENGWENRYYKIALHLDESTITKTTIDNLCTNYLEGLEWTFKYYTEGCVHWRWKYNYHYPPLFADLVKRIPDFETTFIDERSGINRPFHPNTQLAYVIPIWNHNLLPTQIAEKLDKLYYVNLCDLKFQWMFCRYFWESHALLPDIPMQQLELLDSLSLHQSKRNSRNQNKKMK